MKTPRGRFAVSLVGRIFTRLTVEYRVGTSNRKALWHCTCVCGNTVNARTDHLKSGLTKSCGCLGRDVIIERNLGRKTHGSSHTPEYEAWHGAKGRCRNPKDRAWKYYGGRGIEFRFTSFEHFLAELGPRPSNKHSLDRFPNNDGHYEPGNVRWATKSEQEKNKRKHLSLRDFSNDEIRAEYARRFGGGVS